jgi:acyl-CoA synthetase (AMP-forming)/AMP-acid ligase II
MHAGAPHHAGPARADRRDAPVVMFYTAAVDGRARGAVLSQANLVAAADQLGRAWSLGPQDRWLGVLPLFHAAGLGLALAAQGAGGASVLLHRFDPTESAAAIERHGITLCATFSPMLRAILEAAEASGASLASLRVATGLEAPDAITALEQRWPKVRFWCGYGQAEVSSMTCLGRHRDRPGAAGRAAALTELAILDHLGRPLPAGETGEIGVRGPTVFLGYWDAVQRRPVATTLGAGGWHRTGDLGRLDGDGWLWFEGRAEHKKLIKTGGENVYPAEVEGVLLRHPSVAEAFVFGCPDPRWGESVQARCVLKPGMKADAAELIDFVAARLARYKRPQAVCIVEGPLDRNAGDRSHDVKDGGEAIPDG